LLAQPLRQPLPHYPRNDVGRAAGGKADHDADRPRRVGLRSRNARQGRQRDSARCEMQKSTARQVIFTCSRRPAGAP
jgi:hypothetical protein